MVTKIRGCPHFEFDPLFAPQSTQGGTQIESVEKFIWRRPSSFLTQPFALYLAKISEVLPTRNFKYKIKTQTKTK
jgi:hypothetical protein